MLFSPDQPLETLPSVRWEPPPHRTRVNEPIPFYTVAERRRELERAEFNMFRLGQDSGCEPTIDLLTDSGTGAVWAGSEACRQLGRETYAAGLPWARFSTSFAAVTGYPVSGLIPTHQGRAAERILADVLGLRDGGISVANAHFDTTRGNVLEVGGTPIDLPCPAEPGDAFSGNMDVPALEKLLTGPDGHRVKCVVMTITNNARGGQPVSLENMREVRDVCDAHSLPLLLDAARFAENAWLTIVRDERYRDWSPREIARGFFDLSDGCWVSLKKDAGAPMGGVIALRDPDLASECRLQGIKFEGYATYGGMDGRGIEALAAAFRQIDSPLEAGMRDVTDWRLLRARYLQGREFAAGLRDAGMQLVEPCGFHPYLYADRLLPDIPPQQFPGQALATAMWLVGGVRVVELGSLAFDTAADRELVRAAIPRDVYHREHLDYVAHVAGLVSELARRGALTGFRISRGDPDNPLRHFTVGLQPLDV